MVKPDRNARELIAGVVIVCAIALGLLFVGWHDDHVSNKAHDGWPVYRCRTFYQQQNFPDGAWQTVEPLVRC